MQTEDWGWWTIIIFVGVVIQLLSRVLVGLLSYLLKYMKILGENLGGGWESTE